MILKEVKKSLIDQGLTIKNLSSITGYSRGYLSGLINGRHKSSRAEKIISLVLKKSPDDLFEGKEQHNP